MKEPPKSRGKEAKALRVAACAFAAHLKTPMGSGSRDVRGERLHRDLLQAGAAYGLAVSPLLLEAIVVLQEIDDGLVDGSLLDNGVLEYLDQKVRPLLRRLRKASP